MLSAIADHIEDLLPQTQCTKCGFASCREYAEAIADNLAEINCCPPGGATGIVRLADYLGKQPLPLNTDHGTERPRQLALIDESLCIGCTLCIDACPVDAIVGASKQMHTVLADYCTGCGLCIAPCPLDCMTMIDASGTATGWDAWSQQQADSSRQRHAFRQFRLKREQEENDMRLKAGLRRATKAEEQTP